MKGCPVQVILAGEESRLTEECRRQKEIGNGWDGNPPAVGFSAGAVPYSAGRLFGVGLSRPLEGEYRQAVQMITDSGRLRYRRRYALRHSQRYGAYSGSRGEGGPDRFVGYEKLGSALYPGREYCGTVADLRHRISAGGSCGGWENRRPAAMRRKTSGGRRGGRSTATRARLEKCWRRQALPI